MPQTSDVWSLEGVSRGWLKFISRKSIIQSTNWKHINWERESFYHDYNYTSWYLHHPYGWHFINEIPSPDSTKTAKLVHKNNYPIHLVHCLLQHHQINHCQCYPARGNILIISLRIETNCIFCKLELFFLTFFIGILPNSPVKSYDVKEVYKFLLSFLNNKNK